MLPRPFLARPFLARPAGSQKPSFNLFKFLREADRHFTPPNEGDADVCGSAGEKGGVGNGVCKGHRRVYVLSMCAGQALQLELLLRKLTRGGYYGYSIHVFPLRMLRERLRAGVYFRQMSRASICA